MVSILLLESNLADIGEIRAGLNRSGIDSELNQAATYVGLLRELSRHTPDLILMNSRLVPTSNGSAVQHIQQYYPAVPIILLSPKPDVREAVNAVQQGASDYVIKDQIDELVASISKALGDRAAGSAANSLSSKPGHKLSDRALSSGKPDEKLGGAVSHGSDTQRYSALESRLSRQEIIVDLTRQALAGIEIGLLFKHTVAQIAQVFDVEYCEIFELVSYRAGFVLRAAKGWPAAAVNQITTGVNTDSQSGLTLLSDRPIIVQDINADDRLTSSNLLYPTAVNSLISVLISGAGRQPLGLVSAASRKTDRFTQEDAMFLQAIANTLAMATERKRSERSLRTHANEMACLTTVLAKTNDELAERNRELNEFAYVASHDLKAPLRAIANLSEWIEEELQEHMQPSTSYEMSLLRKRVGRIENLLDGLLQYSRVGRLQIDVEMVSTTAVLKDVIDLLSPPKNFTIVIGDNMPVFRARRLLLHQTFSNLIGNAIKHHKEGKGRVEIVVSDAVDFYEFLIIDDGPGIAPEHQSKIFTIFQVLEPRDKTENTGVGLSIAKKIVESEGGRITVESDIGCGAMFRFTWPKG
ncbi:MAG: ATP-binding protein [Elainellaceae cyanobacterium]